MLHSAIHGFIQAEQAGLFVFPQSLDESYERMISTLIDGLVHNQDKPSARRQKAGGRRQKARKLVQ
jgi:hypothetical protein